MKCMWSRRCLASHTVIVGCPHWDSNPDWTDFKSVASADWAMGARHHSRGQRYDARNRVLANQAHVRMGTGNSSHMVTHSP